MSDSIFEQPKKKVRAKRVMTEEQKEVLRERLKKARIAKAAKKAGGVKAKPKEESAPRVIEPVVDKMPVIKEEEPKVSKSVGKSAQELDLEDLRRQLSELKKSNKDSQTEMIKLSLEREQDKKQAYNLLRKKQAAEAKAKLEPKKEKEKPKARYSTYKKSIWSTLAE